MEPTTDGHSPAEAASFVVSPYCRHLRSKKFYFLAGPPRTSGDILDASRHCWCQRTAQALGPDQEEVDPELCIRGRECFAPYGETP